MIAKVLCSSILLYLAFPNIFSLHGFSAAAWVFAVPLLDAIKDAGWSKRLFAGALFGVAAYGLLLSWLWPVSVLGTGCFVAALSVQSIFFTVLCVDVPARLRFFYTAALWSVSEFVRAMMFGGFVWSIAYSQVFHPAWIQAAAWTGTYGVSLVMMAVNYCLWRAWRDARRRWLHATCAVSIMTVCYVIGQWVIQQTPADSKFHQVVLVQGNVPASQKADLKEFDRTIEEQIALTRRGVAGVTDLLVWPETAFPADIFKDDEWYPRLQQLALEYQASFLFGAVPVDGKRSFNSAVLLGPDGEFQGRYDKQLLVPFSERLFSAGQRPGVFDAAWGRFGVAICSETFYPSLVRSLKKAASSFGVVILNDGWFTHQPALMMHWQSLIMRAVENNLNFVSAGNTGSSGLVDAKGRVVFQWALQSQGAGTFKVPESGRPTFYANYGDIFAVMCLLFVIMVRLAPEGLAHHKLQRRTIRNQIITSFMTIFSLITLLIACMMPLPLWAGGAVAAVKQRQLMEQAAYERQIQEEMVRRQQQAMVQEYMVAQQQAAIAQYVQAQQQANVVATVQQQVAQQYMAQQMAQEVAAYQQAAFQRQQAFAQQEILKIKVSQNMQYQQALMARQNQQYMQQSAFAQAVAANQQRNLAEYRQALLEKTVADKIVTDRVQTMNAMQGLQQAQQVMNYQAASALQEMNQDRLYEDIPPSFVKDIVGVNDLWKSLDGSSRAWRLIVDKKAKGITVKHYIDELAGEGATVRKDPLYYSKVIDDMSRENPLMLDQPFKDILRIVSIIDYDYDNGVDKDNLARRIFPNEQAFQNNKKRVSQ